MTDRGSGHGRSGKQSAGHGVANLVGAGSSLVGPVGAMRTRDVSRPRAADYTRAEKTVVLRRRALDLPDRPDAKASSVDRGTDRGPEVRATLTSKTPSKPLKHPIDEQRHEAVDVDFDRQVDIGPLKRLP